MSRKLPYTPIDEMIRRPPTRIMRILRHHGWLYIGELRDMLGGDQKERNASQTALRRLIAAGFVERRPAPQVWGGGADCYDVRLTDKGRAEIVRRLSSDLPIATDREAAEPGSVPCA